MKTSNFRMAEWERTQLEGMTDQILRSRYASCCAGRAGNSMRQGPSSRAFVCVSLVAAPNECVFLRALDLRARLSLAEHEAPIPSSAHQLIDWILSHQSRSTGRRAIRIGTRGSALALAQAYHVQGLLAEITKGEYDISVIPIRCKRDPFQRAATPTARRQYVNLTTRMPQYARRPRP